MLPHLANLVLDDVVVVAKPFLCADRVCLSAGGGRQQQVGVVQL
jgi:hypothetical protein